MKNVLKKTGCLISSICLGSTLFLGSVYAKNNNPTEIGIKANKDEYTQLIKKGKPLHLEISEELGLDITVKDEDGLESHCGYVFGCEMYSKCPEDMLDDGKLSKADLKIRWFKETQYQVEIIAKDKNGNVAKKTFDVYIDW